MLNNHTQEICECYQQAAHCVQQAEAQNTSGGGGKDVFVHISAVERAGLRSLNEGQSIEYEIQSERGKESATNLRVK